MAEWSDKGSRFIAIVAPIETEAEAKVVVDGLWQEHPSARHVCFAYRLGAEANTYRAYDDGEPSGSAGLPIYNRLRSHQLTNTLAAVIRYYGGTKLGISGLIHAYSTTVDQAITDATLFEFVPFSVLELTFGIAEIGQVERVLTKLKLKVEARNFADSVTVEVRLPTTREIEVFKHLSTVKDVRVIKK